MTNWPSLSLSLTSPTYSYISTSNSSTTNLAPGNSYTFTGSWEKTNHPDMMINLFADQDTTVSIQFSQDWTNVDSTITKLWTSWSNDFTTAVKWARYVRVIVSTASLTTTAFRLQTQFGVFRQGNSPLNWVIVQDADALITKTISEELLISLGLFSGYSIVNKFWWNSDIDTWTVPEDVWNGWGVYTWFPTGSPEEFQVFSSNVWDTWTLTFTYLASSTATAYQTASVTLNWTTHVNTWVTGWRVHTAQYSSGSSTTFNLWEITLRHRTTTANVFCKMPIGRSQTNACAYTVPAWYTAKIERLFCSVLGATTAQCNWELWVRTLNGSPRLRRPFSASTWQKFEEHPYGWITITAGSDITVRISEVSANNTDVIAWFDLILIKN